MEAITETNAYPRLNDRLWLICWLCWNDPNGCYTDADTASEGLAPLTLSEARELYLAQVEE